MSRVGILGGTFNPPHVGHVELARHALDELALDRVVFVPAATPPHKQVEDDPGVEHRYAMCRLAAGEDERLSVSRIELEPREPSYTVDTLRTIHASAPGDELTLIVGGDMAVSLPSWREPEALLELAGLAIAERPDAPRDAIVRALTGLGARERARFLAMPSVAVSSSLVRARAAAGEPLAGLVPAGVARYIERHALYGATSTAGAPPPVRSA